MCVDDVAEGNISLWIGVFILAQVSLLPNDNTRDSIECSFFHVHVSDYMRYNVV